MNSILITLLFFLPFLVESVSCGVALEKAISMKGLPEKPIRNITLKNITFKKSGQPSVIENVENIKQQHVDTE